MTAASTAAYEPADPPIAELIAARSALSYHVTDGLLFDGVPLNALADALGTPLWVVSAGVIRERAAILRSALAAARLPADVRYAVKANDHLALLRLFAAEGFGADVVSEGEMRRSLLSGIPPDRIVFSGVGKTETEMRAALVEGIGEINVESAEELQQLSAVATAIGRTARISLRVNPDVESGTHAKIATGRARDKFGVPFADASALYHEAATLPGVQPVGLAVHIGSQILSMAPYRAAYARVADLVRSLRDRGQVVDTVDCGGGLGIAYRNDPSAGADVWAGVMAEVFRDLRVRLILEPGRWLAGPAGLLIASVIRTKQSGQRRFVVLDSAMNDLVRPAMYDAWHGIVPVGARDATAPPTRVDIVGPVCETGDTFARNRVLPPLSAGARVAILDAGAYGSVMSSTYNSRPLAAMALVLSGRWAMIRPRQEVSALWAGERIPDWLE